MKRREFLALLGSAFAARWSRGASPLPFHEHGHALSFSADGTALFAASQQGLAVYEEESSWEARNAELEFSGFTVTRDATYASGTAHGTPAGLLRSTDGGRIWHALALAGEANFAFIAAGWRSRAVYGLTRANSHTFGAAGIYGTRDEGRTWRHAPARGLEGEIHGIAAHPVEPATLALATGMGLYLSLDGGERFRRIDTRQAVTALAFDFDGRQVWYARPLASEVTRRALATPSRRNLPLPPLSGDYVTCLAQSPADNSVMAFATRRRDVYLTRDGGGEWRRIAGEGTAFAGGGHGAASNEEETE